MSFQFCRYTATIHHFLRVYAQIVNTPPFPFHPSPTRPRKEASPSPPSPPRRAPPPPPSPSLLPFPSPLKHPNPQRRNLRRRLSTQPRSSCAASSAACRRAPNATAATPRRPCTPPRLPDSSRASGSLLPNSSSPTPCRRCVGPSAAGRRRWRRRRPRPQWRLPPRATRPATGGTPSACGCQVRLLPHRPPLAGCLWCSLVAVRLSPLLRFVAYCAVVARAAIGRSVSRQGGIAPVILSVCRSWYGVVVISMVVMLELEQCRWPGSCSVLGVNCQQ